MVKFNVSFLVHIANVRVVFPDLAVKELAEPRLAQVLLLLELKHNHLGCCRLLGDVPDVGKEMMLQSSRDSDPVQRVELQHTLHDV